MSTSCMKTAASWVGTEETFGRNKNVPLAAELTYGAMQQQYKQWHSSSQNLVQLIDWWRKSLAASVTTRAECVTGLRWMEGKWTLNPCIGFPSEQHSLEIHKSSLPFPIVLGSTLCWTRLNFNLFFLFFLSKPGMCTLLQNSKILAWGILKKRHY